MHALRYLCLCFPLTIAACGGGSSNSELPRNPAPDYSHLTQAELNPTPLRQASATELEQLVKNGLRLSLHNSSNDILLRNTALAGAPAKSADSNNISPSTNYSSTNVQVDGVDEADFVKYDGKHIYLATPVEYTNPEAHSSLKVLATDPITASVSEIGAVAFDTSHWGNVSEIYLVTDTAEQTAAVATLRRSWNFITFNETVADDSATEERASLLWHYPVESGVEVTLYDVTDPTTPNEAWSLALDGDLLGSRKIGNMLYLVSSFIPNGLPLDYTASSTQERMENEDLIAQTAVAQLLPKYRINDGAAQALNSAADCLVSESTDSTTGHLNLVNITAIDLASRQVVESICLNTLVQGIYASPTNIYLGVSDSSRFWSGATSLTVIHKFSLSTQGVDYAATGAAKGSLEWSSPSFRMDEYEDNLRLVTTTRDENWIPEHHLTVLSHTPGTQTLLPLAQLPSNSRPQAIGKPNEDIYAVRFNGDKAYIVTFERIDPLYVVDLSNPTDPMLVGELEVPGFSTYLHPVGDHYLFGVGNDTDATGIQSGVKMSLFDIRDTSQPQLVNSLVFGDWGTYSEAIYDHRALTFLRSSEDQLRITLPINIFTTGPGDELANAHWLSSGMYLFEINGLSSEEADLTHVGNLDNAQNGAQDYPFLSGPKRGILHDDALFYVHSAEVVASFWPSEINE